MNYYFRDSSVAKIILEPTNVAFNMSDFLQNNSKKDNYFVFSTEENFKVNDIPVFNTVDELRSAIAKAICEKNITKVVVLYEPEIQQSPITTKDSTLQQDTTATTTITETTKTAEIKSSTELLKKILLEIANPKLSFKQRIAKVDESMNKVFSKDLVVETFLNTAGVTSHLWDKGHGKDYLENLATDQSIMDFKVLDANKNTTDSKISYLRVIEIHNQ